MAGPFDPPYLSRPAAAPEVVVYGRITGQITGLNRYEWNQVFPDLDADGLWTAGTWTDAPSGPEFARSTTVPPPPSPPPPPPPPPPPATVRRAAHELSGSLDVPTDGTVVRRMHHVAGDWAFLYGGSGGGGGGGGTLIHVTVSEFTYGGDDGHAYYQGHTVDDDGEDAALVWFRAGNDGVLPSGDDVYLLGERKGSVNVPEEAELPRYVGESSWVTEVVFPKNYKVTIDEDDQCVVTVDETGTLAFTGPGKLSGGL